MRALLLALVGALLMAAPAHAQTAAERASLKIFRDFVVDGTIDPCKHTSKELRLAADAIPPDIAQYASEYPAAIRAAIEARARGDCEDGKAPPIAVTTPVPTPTPKPKATPVPTAIPTKTVVAEPPAPETAPTVTPTAVPATVDPALERVATARPASDAPVPVLLLGVLAGLVLLTGMLLVTMKRIGANGGRLAPFRHTWMEASWRFRGRWEDFRDWLRLGR